tara:strand:+ start:278 stop:445 length:168 start_codon:yes stop_codon:yes gene_type:complete
MNINCGQIKCDAVFGADCIDEWIGFFWRCLLLHQLAVVVIITLLNQLIPTKGGTE